ncbi:ABC transporter permease subunit [Pelagicoccus sp. SDUM812003]|uniref:ABC transporter permease subunit n=1 Tax=Pelagicoccus sp. SDUM812003 TaxID=3041267 RepID=UPI00280E68FE|nr:ABC transporter permease subunit [Pelagicoccus sp. SDUM812003]MDQ8202754.1 ABC transporter permease subunit [Pelagicoccus sp. SDUM812003]
MSERLAYLVRRLLLVIPTFIGITLASFLLCQFVPGGPVEQAMLKMRGDGSASGALGTEQVTEAQRQAIVEHFGFDKPILVRYWDWLVINKMGMTVDSYVYNNKTVGQLIVDRFPVSLTFGIVGFLLTYVVCIPLGIAKALRNGSGFDFASSVLVFIGYAIPAFAFGMLLKLFFSGMSPHFWDIFPAGGFRSADWDKLTLVQKIWDQARHMFLPVLCYIIGNFAVLTLLMKNSLLDQIGHDYVRTVVARGGNMQMAVWKHALRNSLIPIATGFGSVFSIMFAGSVLIERVFNIPGIGLLSLDAIVSRDYMVFMGILALTSIVGLVGRIFSDFCYMLIDPRISFSKD